MKGDINYKILKKKQIITFCCFTPADYFPEINTNPFERQRIGDFRRSINT